MSDFHHPAATRPALRYHGGKWLLAPWVISHFPAHKVYTETFGGAASILIRKARSYAEIYNDLDGEVVGLFRVLRDQCAAEELSRLLRLTPFARDEFYQAYEAIEDPIERARRLIIRSFMGFGSDGFNSAIRTGFRAASNRSGTTPAHDWVNYCAALPRLIDRLSGIVIENRPAIEVMQQHDSDETLHYVDPPYLPETRSQKSRRGKIKYHAYRHEMTPQEHGDLLTAIKALAGTVIISGYPSYLYDGHLGGWHREERRALADGARERTEVLWINRVHTPSLFDRLAA
jgi:DNA adenine methylase